MSVITAVLLIFAVTIGLLVIAIGGLTVVSLWALYEAMREESDGKDF